MVAGCGDGQQAARGGQNGDGERPERIRLVVSEVQDLEALQRNFGPFKDRLSDILGAEIEFYPVPSLSAAAAAFEAGRADLVLAGPSEYVLLRSKADATPVVGFSRPGYYPVVTRPARVAASTRWRTSGARRSSYPSRGARLATWPRARCSKTLGWTANPTWKW